MFRYLLILLFPLALQAEPPPRTSINLVAVKGPYAVSDEQVREVYSEAAYYYRLAGLNLRVKYSSIEIGDNLCRFWHSLNIKDRVSELNCIRVVEARRKNVTIWITPPFLQEEEGKTIAYVAGIADVCGKFGTSNATETSLRTGSDLLEPSAKALAHETLHIFCATHQAGENIMNPDANSFQGKLPVLRVTKRQVARWYAKFGRRS